MEAGKRAEGGGEAAAAAGPEGPGPVFTLQEVARRNCSREAWLVIHGRVYDVTRFLEEVRGRGRAPGSGAEASGSGAGAWRGSEEAAPGLPARRGGGHKKQGASRTLAGARFKTKKWCFFTQREQPILAKGRHGCRKVR